MDKVDYLGLADQLKQALAAYTRSGGTGKTAVDQAEAVAVMLERYEMFCNPLSVLTGRPGKAAARCNSSMASCCHGLMIILYDYGTVPAASAWIA